MPPSVFDPLKASAEELRHYGLPVPIDYPPGSPGYISNLNYLTGPEPDKPVQFVSALADLLTFPVSFFSMSLTLPGHPWPAQGSNNWYYGYWDRAADPDGTYQSYEFTPFPHDGGGYSATDFWDGSKWDWFNGNPPWTELSATGGHPAHNGASGPIHLPIRRWISTIDGTIHITGSLLASAPCGDGVIGRIFVDGVEVKTFPSAGATAEFAVNATVQVGSTVDLAIDPGANDACDSFSFSAKFLQNTIADSG